jgi:hypothetical protein
MSGPHSPKTDASLASYSAGPPGAGGCGTKRLIYE